MKDRTIRNGVIILTLILTAVIITPPLYISVATRVRAEDGGLSEKVKQNPDGTKVRLSGEKIDVDLTKGQTRYENGTELPILTGYITNFTPDRIVHNIVFEIQFRNGYGITFPLNTGEITKVSLVPWQTLQWEHRLTFDDKLKLGNSSANSYSTLVLYNEIDIYKQHSLQAVILPAK